MTQPSMTSTLSALARPGPQLRYGAGKSQAQLVHVPRHLAIVTDTQEASQANEENRFNVFDSAISETIAACMEYGINCLSVYFPCSNSLGPIQNYLSKESCALTQRGVRIAVLHEGHVVKQRTLSIEGNDDSEIPRVQVEKEHFRLNLAVNHDGRMELAWAARALAAEVAQGKLVPGSIDMECLRKRLPSHDLPPVDLLLRTGCVTTLSDFLVWQSAYAELLFMDVTWTKFCKQDLRLALLDYGRRNRTFGALPRNS